MSNLSEEELSNRMILIINGLKECLDYNCNKRKENQIEIKYDIETLETMIDLYNKEKEKNKKLQDDNIKYKNANDYLSSLNHKYYEDNVLLLRKNGHIDILKDNIHFKYIDDAKNYISKDKIREIIYPTPKNPIELEIQNSKMYKELQKLLEEGDK